MSERVKRPLLVRRRCDRGVQLKSCAMSADSFRLFYGVSYLHFQGCPRRNSSYYRRLVSPVSILFVFASVDVTQMEARARWATI